MAEESYYKIPVKNLDERLDGSLKPIRDAARHFHFLMLQKLKKSRKSGKLITSWKFELYNETNASIYSTLPYARAQNLGAKILKTRKMINFFWHMWYTTKKPMWKRLAISKKKYVILPAKNYTDVSIARVGRYVEKNNKIK